MTAIGITTDALLLLRAFGNTSLGEGDEVAGLNTLVSMCAALAAVAGPGVRIKTDHDVELTPGIPWLVSGSLSSALHEAQVIPPLREAQNVFTQNILLARQKMSAAQDTKKPFTLAHLDPGRKSPEFTPELQGVAKDRMLLDKLFPSPQGDRDYADTAARFLKRDALHAPVEFYGRAAFFHDGTDPHVLTKQLQFSHLGYPLVDFPVATRNEAIASGASILGIIDGRGLQTALPVHVRGIATARMHAALHGELIADDTFSPWMNRMLWLTDMPVGPLPPVPKVVAIANQAERFRSALYTILSKRLGEKRLVLNQGGLLQSQRAFIRHLASLEPAIPGITGSLRNLIPTLYFGFRYLQQGAPEGFTWSLEGISALATLLADRMNYAATAARRADEDGRRARWADSFCAKLAQRPHTDRELVRRHNKLSIADCRDVLADLEASGRVLLRDGSWHLARAASLATPQPPVIDVD